MALMLNRLNGRTPLWVSLAGAVVALFLGIYAVISSASRVEGSTSARLAVIERQAEQAYNKVEELQKQQAQDEVFAREILRRLDRIENKLDEMR